MENFNASQLYKTVRGGNVLVVVDGKMVKILTNTKNKMKLQDICWDMYDDRVWFKVLDDIFSYEFTPEKYDDDITKDILKDFNEKYKIKTVLVDMRKYDSPFKRVLGKVRPMVHDRGSYVGSMFYGYCERNGLNESDVIERVLQNFVTKHFPVAMIRDPFTEKERIRQ